MHLRTRTGPASRLAALGSGGLIHLSINEFGRQISSIGPGEYVELRVHRERPERGLIKQGGKHSGSQERAEVYFSRRPVAEPDPEARPGRRVKTKAAGS